MYHSDERAVSFNCVAPQERMILLCCSGTFLSLAGPRLPSEVRAMNATGIALIDDDRSWLEVLSEYLQRKGFSVLTAADASEGLALLGQKNISLVICDYDMPGMTGLELIRSIRRQAGNVAVLMLSNDAEPSLARRALAEGARGFLAKTASPAQLLGKLRQILNDQGRAATQRPALHPWQRLLPSPHQARHGRGTNRPAARSCPVLSSSTTKHPRLSGP
jgi:CheY-like chemotaxis protein